MPRDACRSRRPPRRRRPASIAVRLAALERRLVLLEAWARLHASAPACPLAELAAKAVPR